MECNFENCPNFERLGKKFADKISELEQENERLKEEILKWQTAYSRQYQINENKGYNKKEEQYRQTLQEIKAIAETCCSEINCEECPFTDECNTEMEALGVCRMILKSISKAEEE